MEIFEGLPTFLSKRLLPFKIWSRIRKWHNAAKSTANEDCGNFCVSEAFFPYEYVFSAYANAVLSSNLNSEETFFARSE